MTTIAVLLLLLGYAAVAGSSSGSSGISSSSHHAVDYACPTEISNRLNLTDWHYVCTAIHQTDATEVFAGDKYANWNCITEICYFGVCGLKHDDYLTTCSSSHAHHSTYTTWQKQLGPRASLQWNMFFLIFTLLLGALLRKCTPVWLPYTVGLLIIFLILGMIAGSLAGATDCPWRAYNYRNASNLVTEHEWNLFIGKGYHRSSLCSAATCGADGSTCRWTFSDLDNSFKLSDMHAEKQNVGRNNAVLSADELWTPSCNLLRDMLGPTDIDPHVMLVVFLPILLFESACFGLDIGIFRKQLLQIVLMAFPAMVIASLLTGLLVFAMIPEWSFWVCLLIGVIASATDPVAVVALLKDLGAPKTLGGLIEGESLLNDGSAVVLFVWVQNAIGYTYSVDAPKWMSGGRGKAEVGTELVRVIAQMLLLGLLLGYTFGTVTRYLLRLVYNDRFIEASIVIGMSYLVFWLSELLMGSSAVLAVVVMGLYLNYYKGCISPDVLHFLHQFYEMVAHGLNTVIFAIAGGKLGTLLVEESLAYTLQMYGWQIVAIYPIILFARGTTIAIFFPLLKRLGTGCTWKDAVVMWWGGLRGSVGLALALTVFHAAYDKNKWLGGRREFELKESDGTAIFSTLDCRDQPAVVLLMTLVVIGGTVVINGITMAPLMRLLKMTDTPDDRKFMINEALHEIKEKTESFIEDLKSNAAGEGVNWVTVTEDVMTCHVHYDVQDKKRAAWLTVLNMERCSYTLQFEHSSISTGAWMVLDNYISELAVSAQTAETAELSDLYDKRFAILIDEMKQAGSSLLSLSKQDCLDVAVAYGQSQEDVDHATSHMSSVFKDIAKDRYDNKEAMDTTIAELLQKWDPNEIRETRTLKYLNLCLLKQRSVIQHMKHHGELSDLDAAPLISGINRKIERLYLAPLNLAAGNASKLSSIVPSESESSTPVLNFMGENSIGQTPVQK